MPSAKALHLKVLSLEGLQAQVNSVPAANVCGRAERENAGEIDGADQLGLPDTPRAEVPVQTVTCKRQVRQREKHPVPGEVFAAPPVTETIEIMADEVKAEPAAFEQISEECTFEAQLIGPKLVKHEIVRQKFGKKVDRAAAPVIAPAPARPAAGGYAAVG